MIVFGYERCRILNVSHIVPYCFPILLILCDNFYFLIRNVLILYKVWKCFCHLDSTVTSCQRINFDVGCSMGAYQVSMLCVHVILIDLFSFYLFDMLLLFFPKNFSILIFFFMWIRNIEAEKSHQ